MAFIFHMFILSFSNSIQKNTFFFQSHWVLSRIFSYLFIYYNKELVCICWNNWELNFHQHFQYGYLPVLKLKEKEQTLAMNV